MEVLILLVFVSLVLVTAAVLMFIMRVRDGDLDHGERLSLLPLEEDGESGKTRPRAVETSTDPVPGGAAEPEPNGGSE